MSFREHDNPKKKQATNKMCHAAFAPRMYTHQPCSDIVGLSRTTSSLLYLSQPKEGVQKHKTGVLEHFKLKNSILNDQCETYLKYQHMT
ncbi:hypothetical protein AVEN_188483-1 [Araneus ventricosus]|uniref:Uncharacterized protein n=1 Tax=Araneus ventricosus TaxID=182803 RepID=A0A4Y2MJA1_ARAVE|nr:hypothetical protein AVEN_188483-1 [Araneus ventricosus]